MLLAILGRGIQRVNGKWELTEDLEVCAPTGAPLVDHQPVDDKNPHCLVGGGELNLLAGVELHRRHCAQIIVCAYGNKSPYLLETDAPSESEIMPQELHRLISLNSLPMPTIMVWPRNKVVAGRNNCCGASAANDNLRPRPFKREGLWGARGGVLRQ